MICPPGGVQLLLGCQLGDASLQIVVGEFQSFRFASVACGAVSTGENVQTLQLVACVTDVTAHC